MDTILYGDSEGHVTCIKCRQSIKKKESPEPTVGAVVMG